MWLATSPNTCELSWLLRDMASYIPSVHPLYNPLYIPPQYPLYDPYVLPIYPLCNPLYPLYTRSIYPLNTPCIHPMTWRAMSVRPSYKERLESARAQFSVRLKEYLLQVAELERGAQVRLSRQFGYLRGNLPVFLRFRRSSQRFSLCIWVCIGTFRCCRQNAREFGIGFGINSKGILGQALCAGAGGGPGVGARAAPLAAADRGAEPRHRPARRLRRPGACLLPSVPGYLK